MDGFLPTFTRRRLTPPTFKQVTGDKPSSKTGIPEKVVLPLQDAPHTPYETMVQVGESVRVGQKIGTTGKPPLYLGVHASVSGKVDRVGPMPHPLGFQAYSVSIVSDDGVGPCDFVPLSIKGVEDDGEKVMKEFQEMGVPLNYHLLSARRNKVSNLIINATEFEPYITSRHQLIKDHSQELMEGLKVLIKSCSARQALVLIEKGQVSLFKILGRAVNETPEIIIRVVDHPYPETAIGFLAQKVFPKNFTRQKAFSLRNTMVVDLSSLLGIYDAWFSGTPFTKQLITIVGSGVRDPQNAWARIGTPLVHLIRHAGGFPDHLGRVTLGGPLMGVPQQSLGVPLIKKAKGLFASVAFLFDEHRRSRFYKRVPCIKCAKCVDVCPASIIPNIITGFIDNKQLGEAEKWGVFVCMECGLCEYVCPSRIPLLELLRLGKVMLKGEGCLLTRGIFKTLS